MSTASTFDELIAEGSAVPVEGWDFSWFDGRATEERPPWGYAHLVAERAGQANSILDIQTGGAEVFAEALRKARRLPERVAASESWPPNLAIARDRLAEFGGTVIESPDAADLPFDSGGFDLVVSRHPTVSLWREIARVLAPGGAFLGQLIGERTNSELFEFMMGPQPTDAVPRVQKLSDDVAAAGLTVGRLVEARTRVEFFDVAAIVYFLRKVVWTVPDFTVERYRDRLEAAHDIIQREGSFLSHSTRILADLRAPD